MRKQNSGAMKLETMDVLRSGDAARVSEVDLHLVEFWAGVCLVDTTVEPYNGATTVFLHQ